MKTRFVSWVIVSVSALFFIGMNIFLWDTMPSVWLYPLNVLLNIATVYMFYTVIRDILKRREEQ